VQVTDDYITKVHFLCFLFSIGHYVFNKVHKLLVVVVWSISWTNCHDC